MTSLSAARIRVNQNVISATPSILYFQDQESWFPIQLIPRFTDIKCWNDREIQSKATARLQLIDGKNTKLESKVKFWNKTNQKFPHRFRYTCSRKRKRRISARRGAGGVEGGCGGGAGNEGELSFIQPYKTSTSTWIPRWNPQVSEEDYGVMDNEEIRKAD